jgi:hypothetical protein
LEEVIGPRHSGFQRRDPSISKDDSLEIALDFSSFHGLLKRIRKRL